jgi:hypothetical protein
MKTTLGFCCANAGPTVAIRVANISSEATLIRWKTANIYFLTDRIIINGPYAIGLPQ